MKKLSTASLLAAATVFPRRAKAPTHTLSLKTPLLVAPAPRSLVGIVRADMSDPKALLAQLTATFEEFKTKNDDRLGKVEAKVDPLDVEQFGKISAAVLDLQAALDEQAKTIAAYKLNGGGDISPFADADYSAKFGAYFRTGDGESAIKAMQKTGPRAALSEGTNSAGGYTTPVEWDRTITSKLKLVSPIRAEAQIQTISTIGFSKVFNDRAVGSGWVGEVASRPATSTPTLSTLPWAIGEIYANAAASQDLLDDSLINIDEWLTGEIGYEFARQEGIAFLAGSGTNQPTGVLTYVTGAANAALHPFGAIVVTASGATAGISPDALIAMLYSLPAMWQPNAKFFLNRATLATIMKLKNGQGNYLWQPSYQAGQPSSLIGAPVVDTPDMPNVASGNIAVLYGDMRSTYLIVDRMGLRVMRDPFTNKPFVQFYCTKRVGGGVQQPQAMVAMSIN